jgi:hypothetical protein
MKRRSSQRSEQPAPAAPAPARQRTSPPMQNGGMRWVHAANIGGVRNFSKLGGVRKLSTVFVVFRGTGLKAPPAAHSTRCCHTAVGYAHVCQMGTVCSHRRARAKPHCSSVWVVESAYTLRCKNCTPDCTPTLQSKRCSSATLTKRFTLRPASGQKCLVGQETGPTRQTTMPRSTAYTQSTTRPC